MFDFLQIAISKQKRLSDPVVIKPKFDVNLLTEDLMIRGGDFYAIWNEETGLWSTNEWTVITQIDREMKRVADEYHESHKDKEIDILYMRDSDSGSIDRWHKFCQKQMRDTWKPLDEKVTFSNTKTRKKDHVSKRLPYPLEAGDISAYDELMSVLYDPEERTKLEWAIGSIIAGDSKKIQKFIVLYGAAGSGKSTVLNIIQEMFRISDDESYFCTFNAKELGSSKNDFALDSFKTNPLIAIQHDGDLSKIEDNTKLNSIVSHEVIEVNPKYGKKYAAKFNAFLFMGTNRPVKITEAKSGIIRRLIDVKPSGRKVPRKRYDTLMKQIGFELGAIAAYCLDIYKELGEDYYDAYIPTEMILATNDFYDFVSYKYDEFKSAEAVTLVEAWKAYKEYCDYANCFQMPMRIMQNELRNYFEEFNERQHVGDKWLRNVYTGFLADKFENKFKGEKENVKEKKDSWLIFGAKSSLFDEQFADCPAQYEINYDGKDQPEKKWSNVKTRLGDLDTSKTHYVKTPGYLIMIDFDKRGSDGEKNLEMNIEAASHWPKTYAELSKSGKGIHLYYIYKGDISLLQSIYEENVEIKVFPDDKKGAIRRKLVSCNDIPIAEINSGLPIKKGDNKLVNWDGIKNEKTIRTMILKNLEKKYHADTTSSVDYIKKILDDAYVSGIGYDVTDLKPAVLSFAMRSTNQSDRCIKTVIDMQFKSKEAGPPGDISERRRPIVLDTEIYRPDPETGNEGLFLICWKYLNAPKDGIVVMVNPKPYEVEELFHYDIIGFNCRDYDNHMLYAASIGENNQQLYNRSQAIISAHDRNAKFGEAYNISWCDVYEYCKAAGEGMSLKKWEIKLGHDHKEMGIPWDQPAPKDRWDDIIEYCKNDVLATEAVYLHTQNYLMARKFQVKLAKGLHGENLNVCINDTANTLSKRIMFGNERKPQRYFNYRDLSKPVGSNQYEEYLKKFGADRKFRVFDAEGLPIGRDYIPGETLPDGWSILPFWPDYTFDQFAPKGKKSKYKGVDIGEGGRTYSVPGAYTNVYDGDISSQYPTTIEQEVLFGPEYTKIYSEIKRARIAVKHKDFDTAGKMFGGILKEFLTEESYKDLAQGMKIIINAVYGLTKASFENEFRDPRNIDNFVAKRGNLFMNTLKEQIEKRGFKVCHIKTDSIKIPDATQEIKDFVVEFGREYGYEFETEGEFEKFVLLNDAAYVAKEKDGNWITKAAQFQEPYVRKTLFTKETVTLDDMVQTFNTTEGALYLDYNEGLPDVTAQEKRITYLEGKLKKEQLPKGYSSLDEIRAELEELRKEVKKGHRLIFIGKVSSFLPVAEGAGGGILYRVQDGKPYAASGTTGYRWLEARAVEELKKENQIDMQYYYHLADEAKKDISQYCDFEWFVSDEPADNFMNIPEGSPDEVPI